MKVRRVTRTTKERELRKAPLSLSQKESDESEE